MTQCLSVLLQFFTATISTAQLACRTRLKKLLIVLAEFEEVGHSKNCLTQDEIISKSGSLHKFKLLLLYQPISRNNSS